MCDELTEKDNEAFLARVGKLSRRDFGVMAGSAALMAALPLPANAADVVTSHVTVKTPDGEADCFLAHPASGKAPGFIIWPDIIGLRPAFEAMGKRLAQSGHCVLVVNPYYRSAKAPVVAEGASFSDPAVREKVLPMARSLSAKTTATDTRAFAAFLDAHDGVDTDKGMGASGYCMGGAMAFRSAVTLPERFNAIASFHGSRLVSDSKISPHLQAAKTKADYLVAIASNDDERAPGDKDALKTAFAAAGLKAEVEVYEGTLHGWCPPDSRVYNETQAEHAWSRLLALLEGV